MGLLSSWIINDVSEDDDDREVPVSVPESFFSRLDPFCDVDGDFLFFSIRANDEMVQSRNKAAVDARTIVAVVSGDGDFILAVFPDRLLKLCPWSTLNGGRRLHMEKQRGTTYLFSMK
jgi:hypothetical protein